MPDTSLADKLKRWQTCVTAITPKLEDLAQLRRDHGELTEVIQGIEAFLVDEERYDANLRDTIKKRRALEAQGRKVYGRIDYGLRGHYGKDSPALREFGLDPLSPPTRKRKKEEEPETPEARAAAGGE